MLNAFDILQRLQERIKTTGCMNKECTCIVNVPVSISYTTSGVCYVRFSTNCDPERFESALDAIEYIDQWLLNN